jgi:hypothetical protein
VSISAFRLLALAFPLTLIHSRAPRAAPVALEFTAQVGPRNNIDTEDVFGEGCGANLAGQIIAGSLTIDPTLLTELCLTGSACYGGRSGGSVLICDPSDGSDNYLAVGASSPDGMVQQSIGALFTVATRFDAYDKGDPGTAIVSLGAIGGGLGLAEGVSAI